MPWADDQSEGLIFVAFGHSLDAFTRQMRHMAGLDDGIVDALFRFTRPVTGGSAWCPPLNAAGDALDFSALGL
jgi:putative iron-dependent peroxidase